ncbi:MAG TPA: S8 family peptidase [Elusimicrobiota bacterium]|nr:S8 family peptidase [Elusimicrobiota bacterium]
MKKTFGRMTTGAATVLVAASGIFFAFAAPVRAATTQSQPERSIVVFNSGIAAADRVSIAQMTGAAVVRQLPLIDAVVVEAPHGQVHALQASLRGMPGVLRVDADPKINWLKDVAPNFAQMPFNDISVKPLRSAHPVAVPGAVKEESGPYLTWGLKRLSVPAAWTKTEGKGVKVCVIDTGIDYNHPDLKDNVKGGWNFIANNGNFMDDDGHGTHVAGTIAAEGKDGNVIGVAPEASLYGAKVLDATGSGTFDDVVAGMQWAVQNHMDVASMSLGASVDNPDVKAAVAAMVKAGVVLVAAAGNDGPPQKGSSSSVDYPGAYSGAIAVAAMDRNNQAADFSSAGPQVALIAPGVDVLSTLPPSNQSGGDIPAGGTDPDGYCKTCTLVGRLDGTSMATPHVSGLAALAIAGAHVHGYRAVRAALLKAASPVDGVDTHLYGAGVVNAAQLVPNTRRP